MRFGNRRALDLSADELFDRIAIAERTDQKKRCLDSLVKVELLIIDDWFLTTPTMRQVQQLHTLIDRRHKTASTIYCTQLPPGQWHDRMEEKILADAIVDRITTNAHSTAPTDRNIQVIAPEADFGRTPRRTSSGCC